MATRNRIPTSNRTRIGSFKRHGLLLTNEVTVDAGPGANKAATADHGAAVSKSPLPGRRRTMTSNKLPDSSRAVLPDRYTRIIAPMSSPVLSTSHCRYDEWNERLVDPERRNRPDANDRSMPVTKATVRRNNNNNNNTTTGPTNLIAVAANQTTSAASRIPRLSTNTPVTQHRVAIKVSPTLSPDSSGRMDTSDSSLELSRIGRNRSNNSSLSSASSATGKSSSASKSRLLPPGSIVSAKLAAHQILRLSPSPKDVKTDRPPIIKSKLPVPISRSTRSLPDGSPSSRVSTGRVNPSGRVTSVGRSTVPATKSTSRFPHKTATSITADRGSVSTKKKAMAAAAVAVASSSAVMKRSSSAGGRMKQGGGQTEGNERKVEETSWRGGGSECLPMAAGHSDGGEMGCWGYQGRRVECSLSDPKRVITPLPDEVDHHHHHHHHRHHLGKNNATDDHDSSDSLFSQSAKSEEDTSTNVVATGLLSGLSDYSDTIKSPQDPDGTVLQINNIVIECNNSMDHLEEKANNNEWTVTISIPAAESNEMLSRLECERNSIRGSNATFNQNVVAVDVELMQMLERDLLIDDDDKPATPDLDNPQRSLSLPKSFLATKYGLVGFKAALPSVRLPWRKSEGNRVTTLQTATTISHHPTEAPSNDATSIPTSLPPTGASTLAAAARRPAGSGSTTRTVRRFKSTSSPVFVDQDERVNRSHSAWDLASRPWSHFGEMSVSGSQPGLTETGSVTSIHTEVRESAASPTSSHSTLRKFRKSFSLRLSRRPSQDDTNNEEEQDVDSAEQTSPKFRFGPLVWRASRERNNKKGAANKAARNAKCNSGDSGVQMETTAQPMDETDSSVRRTQSDLGGEAVIVAALRSTQTWTQASSSAPEAAKHRSRKLTRHLAKAHLRRSASQPVVVLPNGIRPDGPSDEDAGLCLSEDDNLSDYGNIPQAENDAVRYSAATEGVLAIALWDHNAVETEELSLQSGDVVHILDLSDPNWWWAARGQQYGWLPASYVQLCEQPFHRKQGLAEGQKFARTLTPAGMAALQHSVRANVINELVTAERDYVKLLSDLVDGYLKPMKNRPDLFTSQRIQSIFGNLEELYQFQKSFLVDLEHSLNWNALEDSVVGGCFLQHIQEFAIYATYCNNQDRAASEMQLLCDDIRYLRFFEACRLLRRMIRLPLEAFLLSPVQKICKYPLQLAELLKHTPDDHPDRRLVSLALDSMRSVAYLVNESKRRAEMQQYLVQWQSGVDHWMGSDITTFNSRLVHQGELFKISSNGWTREVILFLFDKELVICKKELIKRSSLVYKDRLTVEDIEVLEPFGVVDVRPHSFQLRSFSRAKAYLLACRSAQDKNQWVAAIQHLQQQQSSEWPLPAPAMTFGRQKMSNKRSKVKQNPALILTLEEAHLTLEGRDLPIKRKS